MKFLMTTDTDMRALFQAIGHAAAELRQEERRELAVLIAKNLSGS